MREKGKLVLWPAYFDSDYSWRQGRRVSKKLALRGIKSEEVFKAANDLGLDPVLNSGAAYSKRPWLKTGFVLVNRVGAKTGVLRDIALRIRANRVRK